MKTYDGLDLRKEDPRSLSHLKEESARLRCPPWQSYWLGPANSPDLNSQEETASACLLCCSVLLAWGMRRSWRRAGASSTLSASASTRPASSNVFSQQALQQQLHFGYS